MLQGTKYKSFPTYAHDKDSVEFEECTQLHLLPGLTVIKMEVTAPIPLIVLIN